VTGCEKCFGTGSLDAGEDDHGIPLTKPCKCQIARDIVYNVNQAWAGLSTAPKVDESPLSGHQDGDLYITATDLTLRAHLRHVGFRAGPYWYFKVHTDSDLMTAWLSPASLLGKEILDPDAATVSTEKATLVDLVEPPELLILRLGVKSARNSATPEVLLEALFHRAHIGKPTWVVDQPARRFDPSHIAFSEDALHLINQWEHIALDELQPGCVIEMIDGVPRDAAPVQGANPLSLSAGYSSPGSTVSTATRIERPTPEPKKYKPKSKFRGSDK
jgi:hypothetical protein